MGPDLRIPVDTPEEFPPLPLFVNVDDLVNPLLKRIPQGQRRVSRSSPEIEDPKVPLPLPEIREKGENSRGLQVVLRKEEEAVGPENLRTGEIDWIDPLSKEEVGELFDLVDIGS